MGPIDSSLPNTWHSTALASAGALAANGIITATRLTPEWRSPNYMWYQQRDNSTANVPFEQCGMLVHQKPAKHLMLATLVGGLGLFTAAKHGASLAAGLRAGSEVADRLSRFVTQELDRLGTRWTLAGVEAGINSLAHLILGYVHYQSCAGSSTRATVDAALVGATIVLTGKNLLGMMVQGRVLKLATARMLAEPEGSERQNVALTAWQVVNSLRAGEKVQAYMLLACGLGYYATATFTAQVGTHTYEELPTAQKTMAYVCAACAGASVLQGLELATHVGQRLARLGRRAWSTYARMPGQQTSQEDAV